MKQWYLMSNAKPTMLGGFENEYHEEFRETAFLEVLQTDIATNLIIYNYDLSKKRVIRGIIQGNTSDTSLKSMERSVLVPIGTLRSGDYIFFEDEYWIVDGRPGNNKEYEKATLKECQYKLRWQRSDGKIVERWANLMSASKYDVGESRDRSIVLTSNNFTIIIPHDEDSLSVDGKRVFIDSSPTPSKVFRITRNDDVLFLHGSHGGTLSLIADKTELNLHVDRPDLRICNYIDPEETSNSENPKSTNEVTAEILFSGDAELKVGGSAKTLTGRFIDANNQVTPMIGQWDVVSTDEISPYLKYASNENRLKISVLDNEYVGGKIRILFSDENGTVSDYKDFDIVRLF